MAINDKADGEPDSEPVATPRKAPATKSRPTKQAQTTVDLSRFLNAGVKKKSSQNSINRHTLPPPTDPPVAARKRRSDIASIEHSDGQAVVGANPMENGGRNVDENEEGDEESLGEDGDDYELSSDEEWEIEGDSITHVKLLKKTLGSTVKQRNVFAVTFEQEVGACVGDMKQTILGIYRDFHDANRAAQEHSRKQPFKSRDKERLYSDGTFHSRAKGGQRERYNVDVSRVKYTERKK